MTKKNKKLNSHLFVIFSVFIIVTMLSSFGLAQTPTLIIDFETLPDGSSPHVVDYHTAGYPGDPILESYASLGVHFSSNGVTESPAFSRYLTGSNIYAMAWRCDYDVENFNIIITFDIPVYV